MSLARIDGFRIAGVSTCVPSTVVANADLGARFGAEEVRKVVGMAGIQRRHVAAPGVTATDLCVAAAAPLLARLGWTPESITGLVLVTQSPDHFLPAASCLAHARLGLADDCAAFDLGQGCSGYPYGLYVAASLLRAGGQQRILLLHGETPSRFASPDDHTTTLLFGDAGSATALEATAAGGTPGAFCLRTDGSGSESLILRGGAFRDPQPANPRHRYVEMDGAAVFNFTLARVPPLLRDTLAFAGVETGAVDWYLFHQSNRFIMNHLAKKCGLPPERVPIVLDEFGNSGGPSVPLALTTGVRAITGRAARALCLGYGVGLSWASALVELEEGLPLLHGEYAAGGGAA